MTTGKGDQVCLGFLGVTPDIGAASRIVPDDVKEQLPAVSCQLSAFSADGWRLEAGGFQPNILQTVVFSFHLPRCAATRELMVKPHG
jgi:hypothetical protein